MKKKILVYAGIIAAFLVIAYGFVPEVLGGKIVNQSDITGYVGMAHEANEWNATHPDDRTAWTDSMFGGMPTTMLTGNNQGDATQSIFDLFLTGKRPASYLLTNRRVAHSAPYRVRDRSNRHPQPTSRLPSRR